VSLGEGLHLLRHFRREGTEEILFVGEIEIERPVGSLRDLDDVVDAGGVVALRCQHRRARVEQPALRVPAAGAQLSWFTHCPPARSGLVSAGPGHPGRLGRIRRSCQVSGFSP